MAIYIDTRMDVRFLDGESREYREFENALQEYYHTNAESARAASAIPVSPDFAPVLSLTLSDNARMFLGRTTDATISEKQARFTFPVILAAEDAESDEDIDHLLGEFEVASKTCKDGKLAITPNGKYHMHATADGWLSGQDQTFPLSYKRPTLMGSLRVQTIACVIVAMATFVALVIGFAVESPIALEIGWLAMSITITEAMNIAYCASRKRSVIDIKSIAATGNALATLGRTQTLTRDPEIIDGEDIILKPRGERYARSLMISSQRRIPQHAAAPVGAENPATFDEGISDD